MNFICFLRNHSEVVVACFLMADHTLVCLLWCIAKVCIHCAVSLILTRVIQFQCGLFMHSCFFLFSFVIFFIVGLVDQSITERVRNLIFEIIINLNNNLLWKA